MAFHFFILPIPYNQECYVETISQIGPVMQEEIFKGV